ncbi:MAG TPA: fatty acid desaturase [Candidatus Saccharimonadales bacterium]|nr:fatty acid desaturase [Candidatus Saccharimonadales bacterium]
MRAEKQNAKKVEFGKAVGVGLLGALGSFAATSGWMHRERAHGAIKLAPPLVLAARTSIWGTGIVPRVWGKLHRDHHDFADKPGDPHSPVLQGKYGVVKLLWRNPFLYHDKAEKTTEADIPPDLKPDKLDRLLFDKSRLGIAATFAGHMAINKLLGNKARWGVVSAGIHLGTYIAGGNLVNAVGHSGKHPLKALVTGNIEQNDDGNYGADSRLVGLLTLGEGNQRAHHNDPGKIVLADGSVTNQWTRDPFGSTLLALTHTPLASVGEGPVVA